MKEDFVNYFPILLWILGGGIVLSGLLGGLYRAINKVIREIQVLERIFGTIVGGIAGTIAGGIVGMIVGGILGVSLGGILGEIVGGIVGMIAGGIDSVIYAGDTVANTVMSTGWIAGGMAMALSYIFSSLLAPFLILLIYRRIICNQCLRYTEPLRSTYNNGTRHCEHCKAQVERTEECGKVVFTLGNYKPKQGNRMFILSEPPCEEFYNQGRLIDLSEVYIDTKTADKFRIEQFITYILNYPPPKYSLSSVGIFYRGSLDDLAHLKNSILNNFARVAKMGE